MADDETQADPTEETGDEAGSEEGAEEAKTAKKWRLPLAVNPKKLLMIGAPVLLLLGGGFVGVTKLDLFEGGPGQPEQAATVYYDLPEMVVNLSSADKRIHYLKLKISLETSNHMVIDALTPVMPRVLDMFQLYLRELRASDLEGSAGIFRLKEELLRRINLEIHPNEVDRILFKEIIVQ